MALDSPDFAGYLKIAWDTELKKKSRLVLVLCGSVSSWIEKNILNNTGFVGRISLTVTLGDLALPACNAFWLKRANSEFGEGQWSTNRFSGPMRRFEDG